MTRLALVALLALTACDTDTPDWPRVEELYDLSGDAVVCNGAADEAGEPEGGPFTGYQCTWELVLVDGDPACWARVGFARDGAGAPWGVASVSRSAGSCDEQ